MMSCNVKTTSDNVGVKILPPCTFAVMVQRLYADRVRYAMVLGEAREWINLDAADSSSLEDNNNSIRQSSKAEKNCRVISTRDEPGVRKARRGYNLLILENCCSTDCFRTLSPLARQKISWGAPLSHEVVQKEEELLGMCIWKHLKEVGFDINRDLLRVDTFPKEASERVCLDLQKAAASTSLRDSGCTKVSSPYEGPIYMTKSASKCTHVLTVVCVDNNNYVWGIMDRSSFASLRFNDAAAQEVVVEPTHPNTGDDLTSDDIPPDVPVSRAYYKLTQVWTDILEKENLPIEGCFGLDLGASPGGWTQVLRHEVGLSRVLAVDPGILAKRVSSLNGVEHVMADLASPKTASAIESLMASPQNNKCCLLVCDASLDSYLLLDEIIKLLEQLDDNKDTFSLPAAMVITLKLPYKTKGSLERNLQKVTATIPTQLRRMARLMYSAQVRIRYQILHLMANSDSERTLVVVYDKKAES